MKCDILKSFKGSPDGRFVEQYNAGAQGVELTDSLARTAIEEGWAKPSAAERDAESPAAPEEKKKTKGGGKASARSSGSDE